MSKAFVDTTVLTDALLKTGDVSKRAISAIRGFDYSETPVYALKEFAGGPLRYWIWAHNKLVKTRSLSKALLEISALVRTPQKYAPSSMLEALSIAIRGKPPSAGADDILADRYAYAIRIDILAAWKRRRKLTTSVTYPIACYEESPPELDGDGLFALKIPCSRERQCALRAHLVRQNTGLQKIRDVLLGQSNKPENAKRLRVVKELIRNPKRDIDWKQCRHLGDAVFALLAPPDCVILTTNLKDHLPLAEALGKTARLPG